MSDRSRELIRHYHESEWRSTRLDVLKQLGKFQDARSFQFLIEIIQKNEDLSEQHLAILALSQRKSTTSARFLRYFHAKAPDVLKAHLTYALGQVQDEVSIPALLKDLEIAVSKQDYFWVRNIVLALGELKAFSALPKLRRFLTEKTIEEPSLTMAVLFALGRLERDPAFLLSQENHFLEDSLLYQIFQSALSQTQIRSQFKLEDYLSKVFTLPEPHPVLPLELRAFDEAEVEMGLELFDLKTHWKRTLLALKGVSPERRVPHYEKILKVVRESQGDEGYFWTVLKNESGQAKFNDFAKSHRPQDLNVLLSWLDCCADQVKWDQELQAYFSQADESLTIRAINIWNEWALIQPKKELIASVESAFKLELSAAVYTRLIRACAELEIVTAAFATRWLKDLQTPEYRSSILMAFERGPDQVDANALVKVIQGWTKVEKETLGLRILGALESLAPKLSANAALESILSLFSEHFNVEFRIGVLRFLRGCALPNYEAYVIDQLSHQNPQVELNSVIALKNYGQSPVAGEAVAEKLKSSSPVIRGRALDSLCAHAALVSKRAVMNHLKEHLADELVVDKIYRSFDPQKKGGPEFAKQLDDVLLHNPEHPQWEKLVQLRDRLNIVQEEAKTKAPPASTKSEALKEVDQKLITLIPQFLKLDSMAQAALRAAEDPFRGTTEMQNLPIDKAPTVLEYCKALDLILEKYLGQKYLFPKLDTSLHEFQTVWHRIGFMEDYPSADKVMTALGIKGKMSVEHFPLHKAKMMAGTFFNGKILQDRFKVFDGLRAWAVIFLVFARKLPGTTGPIGPMLKLPNASEEECVSVAKRLMVLQDLRNPAAHRQTYTDLASVMVFRNEAIQLLNTILKFYD